MMNQNAQYQPTEVDRAMAELIATRGARFDKQDFMTWLDRLEEHNHSGLTIEAARAFAEDDGLQDTPLTLAAFIRVVKQVRIARIKAREADFPQPPSGISDEQYREWMRVRNECAVRQVPTSQIDAVARQAIHATEPKPISTRPAHALRLPSPK